MTTRLSYGVLPADSTLMTKIGRQSMSGQDEILVVDDTLITLNLLTDILSTEGFQVRSADTGEEALHSVASEPPHLILLDVKYARDGRIRSLPTA